MEHPYIKALFDKINNYTNSAQTDIIKSAFSTPLFDAKDYPKAQSYTKFIVDASKEIFEKQMNKIELDVSRANKCLQSNFNGKPQYHSIVMEFTNQIEPMLNAWHNSNNIIPLMDNKKLNF